MSTDTGPIYQHECLISVQEAAKLLGVSPRTIYSFVSQRRICHRKIGRRVVFLPSELLEWTKPRLEDRNPKLTKR